VATGTRSGLLTPGQSGISLDLGIGWWGLWSPDGLRLLGRTDAGRLVERFVNGSGETHDLGEIRVIPQDISPDGKQVLTMVPLEGTFASRLAGSKEERSPQAIPPAGEMSRGSGFSPDGRWIVYSTTGKGRDSGAVYVQAFPGNGLRHQIAPTSGFPIWRKDGKEIVIADGSGSVWSIPVSEAAGGLSFGERNLLFSGLRWPAGSTYQARPLAVSRDGSRFYLVTGVEQPEGVIHVRLGWAKQ